MALNPTALALADGQLGNSKATLYTAPAAVGTKVVIPRGGLVLVNTGVAKTINVYVNRTGTSRLVSPKDFTLQAGNDSSWENKSVIVLEASDLLEGECQTANVVDYVVSGWREDP